jgi:hypothetical protein
VGAGDAVPGTQQSDPPDGSVQLARLVLDGDAGRIDAWLGDHALPVVVRPGSPAVAGIVLSGPGGEIVLDADPGRETPS